MDLRQLKRFIAVSEFRSFGKAAEALAVSQPSLTRSIQFLEESLGVKLLERGPRGILLTPIGEELLSRAKIILNERDRAISSINSMKGLEIEQVSTGTDPAFSAGRLPLALAKFSASHPNVKVKVVEGDFPEILDRVREGTLDMAFGSRDPYLDITGLNFEQLAVEKASVMVGAGHPILKKKRPRVDDLLGARWIVSDKQRVIEGWAAHWAQWKVSAPPIALYASSIELIKQCLLHADYISIGDHSTYSDELNAGRLIAVEFEHRYSRPSGLFRRTGTRLSRSALALIELLRRICKA